MRYIVLICLFIAACATAPMTNQIEATSKAFQDLAIQVDRLQKAGVITNEQEDKFMDRLAYANGILGQAAPLAINCAPGCAKAANLLDVANTILIQLQTEVGGMK